MSDQGEEFGENAGSREAHVHSPLPLTGMAEQLDEFQSMEFHAESSSTLTGETVRRQDAGDDAGSSGQANVVSNSGENEQRQEAGAVARRSRQRKVISFPDILGETGQRQEPGAAAGPAGQANVVSKSGEAESVKDRAEWVKKAVSMYYKSGQWRKQRRINSLQQKYIQVYVQKKLISCPDTRCNNYQPSWNVVTHFLKNHFGIPRSKIEFDTIYTSSIKLHDLEYGRSQCIAVYFFPLLTLKEGETPDDSSVMPLVVLAAKIHPCGNLGYVQSHTAPATVEAYRPVKDGDLLMVWVCGHVETITSKLEVYNSDKFQRHMYNGYIHSMTDSNHDPQCVYFRGNCLLIPATNIKALAENGELKLDVLLSIRDEDL